MKWSISRLGQAASLTLGSGDLTGGLKRPELTGFVPVGSLGDGRLASARIGGADLDPQLEVGHDRRGQLAVARHLHVPLVPQRLEEQTLARLPGDQRRARIASREHSRPRIEQQIPLELAILASFFGMAPVAMFDQYGANLRLEKLDPLRIQGLGRERRSEREKNR